MDKTFLVSASLSIDFSNQIKTVTDCDKNCEENDLGVRSGTTERSLWGDDIKAETWKKNTGEDGWGGTLGTPSGERPLSMKAVMQERAPRNKKEASTA